MAGSNGDAHAGTDERIDDGPGSASKPKRVRTGCLTCRERHLKCDEAMPNCMNCRKSSRQCKRGVRLNFLDIQCRKPPVLMTTNDRNIAFFDESQEIASEYVGGEEQYSRWNQSNGNQQVDNNMSFDYNRAMPGDQVIQNQRALPASQSNMQPPNGQHSQPQPQSMNLFDQPNEQQQQQLQQHHQQGRRSGSVSQSSQTPQHPHLQSSDSTYSHTSMTSHHTSYDQQMQQTVASAPTDDQGEAKEILNTQEETLYMQVFVEEVGLWMDSMDSMKHFSRILPFHALTQPMLLNAFLACGVRHLTLVNPAVYQEEKALHYYDIASRYLLRALENPERDSVICAATAVILNVYEIMTEKALMRMNHIAGARALIKECGWNARSEGIGAACFWVNVGMELLSNLHFNWKASWNPDHWGLDLDLSMETRAGREEVWTHKILYITAKIGDFRAAFTQTNKTPPQQNDASKTQKRLEDWEYLRHLADTWNANIPRTMHPVAYLYAFQTRSTSAFPEVWLIKRSTIIARLFYHTAMCLLSQVHPIMSRDTGEMHELEQHHAHQICGIVAHVKDRLIETTNNRGVASVALRSLAIAAECLTSRREQEEVLQIFIRTHKETGWRIGFIPKDLMEKWGWDSTDQEKSSVLPTQADPVSNHHLGRRSSNTVNGGMMGRSSYAPSQFDQYGEMQRLQQQQAARASQQRQQSVSASPQQQQQQQQHQQQQQQQQQQQKAQAQASPQQRKVPPQGIVNPMFATADFGMAKHPYQEYYVAPSHQTQQQHAQQQQQVGGLGLGMPSFGLHSNNSGYQF